MNYNEIYFLQEQVIQNKLFNVTNANSVLFWNQGTTVCTILGSVILQPGQQIVFSGNLGEIINQQIQINFAGGVGLLQVLQKMYKE